VADSHGLEGSEPAPLLFVESAHEQVDLRMKFLFRSGVRPFTNGALTYVDWPWAHSCNSLDDAWKRAFDNETAETVSARPGDSGMRRPGEAQEVVIVIVSATFWPRKCRTPGENAAKVHNITAAVSFCSHALKVIYGRLVSDVHNRRYFMRSTSFPKNY
jgi:hypothetical protein